RAADLKLPLGYAYAATYAGIRQIEKDDLALIVSGLPASAAAVFTQNLVQASPVRLGRSHLKASKGLCGAVVINAGNANCATRTGDAVALATCKAAPRNGARSGHDEGQRHDPADDGDHAGFRDDGRTAPAGAIARHAEARCGAQLPPHLGGWRHFDQRYAAAAGQRRIGSAASWQGTGDA